MRQGKPILCTVALAATLFAVEPAGAQTVLSDQRLAMSDGVELIGDVNLPPGQGPRPVILKYTPFGRADYTARYASDGYVHLNRHEHPAEQRPHRLPTTDTPHPDLPSRRRIGSTSARPLP